MCNFIYNHNNYYGVFVNFYSYIYYISTFTYLSTRGYLHTHMLPQILYLHFSICHCLTTIIHVNLGNMEREKCTKNKFLW